MIWGQISLDNVDKSPSVNKSRAEKALFGELHVFYCKFEPPYPLSLPTLSIPNHYIWLFSLGLKNQEMEKWFRIFEYTIGKDF